MNLRSKNSNIDFQLFRGWGKIQFWVKSSFAEIWGMGWLWAGIWAGFLDNPLEGLPWGLQLKELQVLENFAKGYGILKF